MERISQLPTSLLTLSRNWLHRSASARSRSETWCCPISCDGFMIFLSALRLKNPEIEISVFPRSSIYAQFAQVIKRGIVSVDWGWGESGSGEGGGGRQARPPGAIIPHAMDKRGPPCPLLLIHPKCVLRERVRLVYCSNTHSAGGRACVSRVLPMSHPAFRSRA